MITFLATIAVGVASAATQQPGGAAPVGKDGKPKVVTLAPVVIATPTSSTPAEPQGGGAPWGAVVAIAAASAIAGAGAKAAKDKIKP